jgi:hypothetical protein
MGDSPYWAITTALILGQNNYLGGEGKACAKANLQG